MSGRWSRLLVILGILLSLAAFPAASPGRAAEGGPPEGAEFAPGTILVRFREATAASTQEQLLARYGASYKATIYGSETQIVRVPEGHELEIIKALSAEPGVAYAEPDYIYRAVAAPNDPSYSKQWAHTAIMQSSAAWDITTGNTTIVIAVIDSGVDETHPDLNDKLVAGHSFLNEGVEDSNPHDLNGHGTHCSGIAAAETNNATGVAGMSWGARIMPVRVLGASGSGYSSDIIAGINWAVSHGADILSLSLGGASSSTDMQAAINAAHTAGVLVIAAMGNNNVSTPFYPAAYNNVFAVAATTPDDTKASYSNFGAHCDIAAPGGEMTYLHDPDGIYSTFPTYDVYLVTQEGFSKNYDYLQGTSQATPYVSGLAALVWTLQPTFTPDQVQAVIQSTAVDLGTGGWDQYYGWGRINAFAAVQSVAGPPAPVLNPISNADLNGNYLVDWEPSTEATTYLLQEDDVSTFATPTQRYLGAATQLTVTAQPAGVWYYRVQASNADGADSLWSGTQSTGVAPAAPVLNPISNASHADAYTLSWNAVPGVVGGYVLQEDDNSGFTTPLTRYSGSALSLSVTGQAGGTWYYRVYAFNTVGSGPASATQSTIVNASTLAAPTLNPISNADQDGAYSLSWSTVLSATSYTLEESDNAYFVNPAVVYSGPATSYAVNGQSGGNWHYRVRAFTASASSPWSGTQSTFVRGFTYVPLVTRNYPVVQAIGLPNGSFELGDTVWASYSSHGWDIIMNSGFPGTVLPHGGSWAAWLGGDFDDLSYIQQSVTVPAGSYYLAYWHWIASEDACGYYFDEANVLVNGVSVKRYDLCSDHDTGAWVKQTVSLSAYAGQTVALRFQVVTDSSLNSNFFLDDVAWQSGAASEVIGAPQADAAASQPRAR